MNALRKLIVSGLGTGYLPVAPGTWGCLPPAALFLAVAWATGGSVLWASVAMGALAVASSGACVLLGAFSERTYGRKDPSQCVIDEWAGQSLALIAMPLGDGRWPDLLIAAGTAFLAFRLFDILKPPPARRMERLPLGWGVLLDDLVAGVYAGVTAQLAVRCAFGMLIG